MPRPRTNKNSADPRTKAQLLALIDRADQTIATLTAQRDDAMRRLAQETTARIEAQRERDNCNEERRSLGEDVALARKARDWNAEKLDEATRQHARDMAALKRRLADAERECNESLKESLKLKQTREMLDKAMETSAERYRAWQRARADLAQLRSVVTNLADAMRAAASENGAA